MADPVLFPAAVKGFIQGVRIFRGFLPDRSRSYEELLADVIANPIPATREDFRAFDAKDQPTGRRASRRSPQSTTRGSAAPSRAAPDVPQAEPIRPSPPAGEVAQVPPAEVVTDVPTGLPSAAPIVWELAKQGARAAAQAAARLKAARAADKARKALEESVRRATEAAKAAEKAAKTKKDPGRGVIRREDAARQRQLEREKVLRDMGKTQRRGAETGRRIEGIVDPVQEIKVQTKRRTERQEIIKRSSPKRGTTTATKPSVNLLFPLLAGLAVIATPAVLKQTRGTRQGGRRVLPRVSPRLADIGFQPSGRKPLRVRTPSPFTDPLTPTSPQIGVGTQTSTTRFSRVRQRTKECQEVLRRRRRKGECKEGFFEELPGRTRFTTWRTYDCKTGKTVKRK